MKRHATMVMAAGILAAMAALPAVAAKSPPKKPPHPAAATPTVNYDVVNEFKIGGLGPWSSITLDAAGKYLYVPRDRQTQVIDTATGKLVADIPTQSAKCVVLVPDADRGFITNGPQGTVTVFDLKTNAVLGDVAVGANANAMIYDPASKRVLVHCGPSSIVPFAPDIDLKTGKPEPAIVFDGNIHGLVADGHGMVYVTLMDKNVVAVLDTRTMTIATRWPVGAWKSPAAIAMDRLHSRLFVCCRSNWIILSASDGHILDEIATRTAMSWKYPSPTGVYYDGHFFGVCGDGVMTVLGQKEDGAFVVEDRAKVEPNSQPIAVDGNNGKIYLPTEQIDNRKPVPGTFKILVLQKK